MLHIELRYLMKLPWCHCSKQCHCVVFDLSSAAEIIYSREKEENERHSSSTAKLV